MEKIYGYVMDEYWTDIGNTFEYKKGVFGVLDGRIEVLIRELRKKRNKYISSNAEIDKSVKIYGPCFIGNNVVIEKNTVIELYTVISDNLKISSNISVEKINSLREFKKRQQCKNNKHYSVFRHNNTGQYNIV